MSGASRPEGAAPGGRGELLLTDVVEEEDQAPPARSAADDLAAVLLDEPADREAIIRDEVRAWLELHGRAILREQAESILRPPDDGR